MPSTPRPAIRLSIIAWTAAFAELAATSAAAQDESKFYAGVGLGVTAFKTDHEGIRYDESPYGLQLYGGLQARERIAVEIAVERLADMGPQELPGSGVERLQISAEHSSVTVRGVLSLSLEELLQRRPNITLFGMVGAARLSEERTVVELTRSRTSSVVERDTALVLGAGVTFEIARVRLRTYIQSTARSDGDLNSIGAAAEFRF